MKYLLNPYITLNRRFPSFRKQNTYCSVLKCLQSKTLNPVRHPPFENSDNYCEKMSGILETHISFIIVLSLVYHIVVLKYSTYFILKVYWTPVSFFPSNYTDFLNKILQISFTACVQHLLCLCAVYLQKNGIPVMFIWDMRYARTLIIIAVNSLFVTEPIIPH